MASLRIVALATVAFTVLVGSAAHAQPTWCGGTVPAGTTAVLSSDLECGLVRLERDATLDLNGHTLTAMVMGPERGAARFTLRGPGEVNGQFPENPCVMFNKGKVLIDGGAGQVMLRKCQYGVLASTGGSTVTLRHVTMRRTGVVPMDVGVQANKVDATDVTIDHSDALDVQRGHGIHATSKLTGAGIVLQHLGDGLGAKTIVVSDVVADDTHAAVAGPRKADLTRLTSTRHNVGVYGRRVRLTDSSLSDANPSGVDVATSLLPLLVGTACETSAHWDPLGPGLAFAGTWNVCALD
jgi:hypothetical protein